MADIPTTEPQTIRAGDTIRWTKELSDYPASLYTLAYRLINSTDTYDITATADGDIHSVEIATTTSDDYVAGEYTWYSFVTTITPPTERYTIEKGVITILPDPATATDFRTNNKKTLDKLEAFMAGSTDLSVRTYVIAGRTLERHTPSELIRLIEYYKGEVRREEASDAMAAGASNPRRKGIEFRDA